jgi:hypothetical protein
VLSPSRSRTLVVRHACQMAISPKVGARVADDTGTYTHWAVASREQQRVTIITVVDRSSHSQPEQKHTLSKNLIHLIPHMLAA